MCNLLTIQPPSVLIYKQLLLTELMEYYFCHKIPFNQKEKKKLVHRITMCSTFLSILNMQTISYGKNYTEIMKFT